MLHTSIFYEILETYMVFFANSKYVKFHKNTYFFSYLSSVITPQLKKHTVSVSPITFSILDHFKQNSYGAQLDANLYVLSKPHFMIFALRSSKAAPTKHVPFSRFSHLDNYKKNYKITNLIFEK